MSIIPYTITSAIPYGIRKNTGKIVIAAAVGLATVGFPAVDLANPRYNPITGECGYMVFPSSIKRPYTDITGSEFNARINQGDLDFECHDLSEQDISGSEIGGFSLRDLDGINLRGAILRGAKVRRVSMDYGDIGGADFTKADGYGSHFGATATDKHTKFNDANVDNTVWRETSINGVDFTGATGEVMFRNVKGGAGAKGLDGLVER